jgi:ATP-dependent helicase/nuclease subunit A
MPDAEEIIEAEQHKLIAGIEKIKSLRVAISTESVLELADPIIQIFENLKREASVMDYDDLIHKAHELLSDKGISPWVMYKLDGGIDYILIDEAQDTSPIQWDIIRSVCDEFFSGKGSGEFNRRIFVVGDEKQSIFSFQGADPKEFNKMHEYFSERAKESNHNWEAISLQKSYRSTEAVLKVVDASFADEKLKSAISSKVEKINHQSNRTNEPGRVELWPAITAERENDEVSWPTYTEPKERPNVKKELAEKIADEITNWISDKRIINTKSGAKLVSPGDILILVRNRDELVNYLVKAFKKRNVKIAGVDRLILSEYIAVMDLIALGNFILLPEDDLNLATLLKSPLFNFSEEELFNIAHGREETLWQSLKDNDAEPYTKATKFLAELIESAKTLSPFNFYNEVLEVKSGRKKFIARIGDEVIDPLNEFLNLCFNFEKSHTTSLQKFIQWFLSGKREIKRDLEQGSDAIRIMTTHASKGLQAPIVFLADTTALPRNLTKVFWQEDGLFLWPGSTKNFNKTCRDLHKQRHDGEYDEYLRLLYVAMTRAADELYICGTCIGEPHQDSWYNIIKRGMTEIATEEDGKLVITSGSNIPHEVESVPILDNKQTSLPKFATIKVEKQRIKTTNNDNLSQKFSDKSQDNRSIGTALHRLLEILPSLDEENRAKIANDILRIEFPSLASPQELINKAIKVINHDEFKHIFADNSFCERDIAGILNGIAVTKRIDKMVINEDEIIIIDYKSGAETDKYREQMLEYKLLIEQIYPDKKVSCFLLWIDSLKLTEV